MIKVSVIMPVYNSKDYLDMAVTSVLDQDYDSFELILIDDGSNDESSLLCDKFAAQDDRVKVIHKKNGGLCSARNAGLDAATGEYIAFIDNDDEYLAGYLKDNTELADRYGADVVRFNRRRVTSFPDRTLTDDFGTDGFKDLTVLTRDDLDQSYAKIKRSGSMFGIWNGIYRRSMIEARQIRFDESIRYGGEDWLFNLQVYQAASSYVMNPKSYYHYYRRYGQSTSTKFHVNRIEAIVKVHLIESVMPQYRKTSPVFQCRTKILALVEVFTILSNPNCDWTNKQKKEYVSSILAMDAFDPKQLRIVDMWKAGLKFVFIGGLIKVRQLAFLLFFFSRIYTAKN
jgi:glycosyltransferase involved in cell wall biosynthesis